jgi:DNA (cytosine-5)-methyltransferase 1
MDYFKKTRDELITLCKEMGIKGYSGKKKCELISIIEENNNKVVNKVVNEVVNNDDDDEDDDTSEETNELENIDRCDETPEPINKLPLSGMKFIDLFCGIGGFHSALSQLGGTCVLACDIDTKCREVYKNNWGLEPKSDIKDIKTSDIPDFDILCGGFPCQAFSHAGKQNGLEDTRGTLFQEIARILKDKQPKYYLLENVKNLRGHDEGRTIKIIYNALKEVGYTAYPEPIVLSPHHIGVPQNRERVFLLGIRNDIAKNKTINTFPLINKKKTDISSILEPESVKYPELELSSDSVLVLNQWESFVQHFKLLRIKLPSFPIWTEFWAPNDKLQAEIDEMPDWKQAIIQKNNLFYNEHISFLKKWLLNARECTGFIGSKTKFEWQCGEFKDTDSLWTLLFTFRPSGIRVKRSNYSPTLVAMAQIVVVGSRRRKLSPKEVARLQSFPDTFKLPQSNAAAYKQFGNSVNVDVIKWMARFLVEGMMG